MGPPQLSNAVRWQTIGMREAGMSLKQITQRVGHHHSTVSRTLSKFLPIIECLRHTILSREKIRVLQYFFPGV